MQTKQATVLPSGWEAQVENTDEIRPLTQYHTPGAKVTVREVWKYCKNEVWAEVTEKEGSPMYPTRIAFEVVSEEESKAFDPNKKDIAIDDAGEVLVSYNDLVGNSVEEAAEKFIRENILHGKTAEYVRMFGNHIIQSGEYVSKAEVIKMLELEIEMAQKSQQATINSITRTQYVLVQRKFTDFLTTLKNNQ